MAWLSFDKLNDTAEHIIENIDLFLDYFNVDVRENAANFSGPCPIHTGSDNDHAFIMYKNTGTWVCNTHGCHNIFKKTPVGFIRALLSSRKNHWKSHVDNSKIYSFHQTLEFIEGFLKERPVTLFKKKRKINQRQLSNIQYKVPLDRFLQQVKLPSEYFLQRGFSDNVLQKYFVGTNLKKKTPLSDRELVPILDDSGQFVVACSARINKPKCLVCSGYHKFGEVCPDPKEQPKAYQKWAHSKGFQRTNHLYNYWIAQHEYLNYNKELILVEGPLEVWRLAEAGFHNGLAIFGADLTQNQADLIHQLKPSKIFTIMDNDDGGLHAEESCKNLLSKYELIHLCPSDNDLGDMSIKEVMELLS